MRHKDPILEELHAVRAKLLREADYDLEKLVDALRAGELASGVKTVSLPPRKITRAKKVS